MLIYTAAMGVFSYPNYRESGNWSEFWLIIGACMIVALLLYIVLKRKQKIRDNFRKK